MFLKISFPPIESGKTSMKKKIRMSKFRRKLSNSETKNKQCWRVTKTISRFLKFSVNSSKAAEFTKDCSNWHANAFVD